MVLHCRKARVRARQVSARAAPKPIAFAARPASRDRPRKRPKVARRQPVKRHEKKEQTQAPCPELSSGICVVWQLNHRRPLAEGDLARKRAAVVILSAVGANACEHARQTPMLLCVPRVVEGDEQNVVRVMANPEWKVDHARRKRAVLVDARLLAQWNPSMGVNSSVQPCRTTRRSAASLAVAFPQTACQSRKRVPCTRSVKCDGLVL